MRRILTPLVVLILGFCGLRLVASATNFVSDICSNGSIVEDPSHYCYENRLIKRGRYPCPSGHCRGIPSEKRLYCAASICHRDLERCAFDTAGNIVGCERRWQLLQEHCTGRKPSGAWHYSDRCRWLGPIAPEDGGCRAQSEEMPFPFRGLRCADDLCGPLSGLVCGKIFRNWIQLERGDSEYYRHETGVLSGSGPLRAAKCPPDFALARVEWAAEGLRLLCRRLRSHLWRTSGGRWQLWPEESGARQQHTCNGDAVVGGLECKKGREPCQPRLFCVPVISHKIDRRLWGKWETECLSSRTAPQIRPCPRPFGIGIAHRRRSLGPGEAEALLRSLRSELTIVNGPRYSGGLDATALVARVRQLVQEAQVNETFGNGSCPPPVVAAHTEHCSSFNRFRFHLIRGEWEASACDWYRDVCSRPGQLTPKPACLPGCCANEPDCDVCRIDEACPAPV